MHEMGPRGPKHCIFGIILTQKMPEILGSIHFSIVMLENTWYHHFIWSGPNSQEIVNFFQFSSGPRGPTIGTKFTISCEFGPLQVKWWRHMFSNMKNEECMESELSSIFRVKVVAKNILLRTLGTQRQAVFAMWCLFLKKKTNLLNQTVRRQCFPCLTVQ